MADILSAAARPVLPAIPALVDHRRPYHDQICRCVRCKPRTLQDARLRHQIWQVALTLLAIFWLSFAYVAFGQ